MKLNQKVVKCLILAQAGSDAGKHLDITEYPEWVQNVLAKYNGYYIKDRMILKALQECSRTKTGFYYSVQKDNCMDPDDPFNTVVYFKYKVNRERRQISFHTGMDLSWLNKPEKRTRWSKNYESRNDVYELIDMML